jgi:hypothetical protein
MVPSQRKYVKCYWKKKNAVDVQRRCIKKCATAVRTRVRNARLHWKSCSCVTGLDILQRQFSPDTGVNKPRVHRIAWHEKWKPSVPSGPIGISCVVTVPKVNVLLISSFGLTTQLVDWLAPSIDTATCTGHQTSRSSCTVDVSVVQSVFRALARLFLLAISVLGAAYLSVLRDNAVLSVFRGRVSVHQDGVLVCTSPNRRQICSQCSLSQIINMAYRKGAVATPITCLNILLRLLVEHSKGQNIP